jgi:hypothetical protein
MAMIEIYGGEYDLDIQFRRAGTIGIERRILLPDGDVIATNMVSASHVASVLRKMTTENYADIKMVRDMLSDSVCHHLPTRTLAFVLD